MNCPSCGSALILCSNATEDFMHCPKCYIRIVVLHSKGFWKLQTTEKSILFIVLVYNKENEIFIRTFCNLFKSNQTVQKITIIDSDCDFSQKSIDKIYSFIQNISDYDHLT